MCIHKAALRKPCGSFHLLGSITTWLFVLFKLFYTFRPVVLSEFSSALQDSRTATTTTFVLSSEWSQVNGTYRSLVPWAKMMVSLSCCALIQIVCIVVVVGIIFIDVMVVSVAIIVGAVTISSMFTSGCCYSCYY